MAEDKRHNVLPADAVNVIGARVHNLKNIDVSIPHNKLTVITGLSGSGKSSLAFDTIYAEGQRRYIETFSSYARGMLGALLLFGFKYRQKRILCDIALSYSLQSINQLLFFLFSTFDFTAQESVANAFKQLTQNGSAFNAGNCRCNFFIRTRCNLGFEAV